MIVKDGGVLKRVVIPSEVRVVVERGAKVVIEECAIEGREIPCQPFVVPRTKGEQT